MKIAWFTDITAGSNSQSAYLSETLLPLLDHRITIFTDCLKPLAQAPFPCRHYSLYNEEEYEVAIYLVEDHKNCRFVLNNLGRGIYWFHSTVFDLQESLPIATVNRILRKRRLLRRLSYYQEVPDSLLTLAHIKERSTVNIFSHPWEIQSFDTLAIPKQQQYKNFYLPLPILNLANFSKFSFESQERSVVLVMKPDVSSHIHTALSALSETKKHLVWYVDEQDVRRAEELIREFNLTNFLISINTSLDKYYSLLHNASVVIGLNFSTQLTVEPYVSIATRNGVPTIVSDFAKSHAEFADHPLIYRVPLGVDEENVLVSLISELASQEPSLRYDSQHSPEQIRSELIAILADHNQFISPENRKELRKIKRYTETAGYSVKP